MDKLNSGSGLLAIVVTALFAAAASSFITYKATENSSMNFAVVDLQRVVASSKDIEALKNERNTQIQDLKKMADAANEKIKAVKDEDAKKKVSEKYLNEINSKKDDFDKVYASALLASDQKLNDIINSVADKEGLTIVFNKNSLVSGGTDITESVIDLVK